MKFLIKGIDIRKQILKAVDDFLYGYRTVFEHPLTDYIRPEAGNAFDFEEELGCNLLFREGVFIGFNIRVFTMLAMGIENGVEIITGIDVFEITSVFIDEIKGFAGYLIIIRAVIAAEKID